jgi:transmembrane sensor
MNNIPDKLIDKFISGKRLTGEEYILLDKLLNKFQYRQDIIHYLEKKYNESQPESVALKFEQIREKIRISSAKTKMNRLFIVLSKAAAILFIPLLVAALYFYFNKSLTTSGELLALTTQKGEHTSVILPDGSKAWLNVDTRLSYPVDYGVNSRNLVLEGEAYFEVEKNEELPFEVISGNLKTRALGTRFVISAYPKSSELRSSLLEGSVQIGYGVVNKILKPGQQIIVNKKESIYDIQPFNEDYELAWKNNQLIFRLTPFDIVMEKLEKWYDINIEYNPEPFRSETLTVRFERYETLEQVLKVITKATGSKYSVNDKNVIIKK